MSKFCNVPHHVMYLDGCHECAKWCPVCGDAMDDYVFKEDHDHVRAQLNDAAGVIRNAACMAAQDQIHIVNVERALKRATEFLQYACGPTRDVKAPKLQGWLAEIDALKKGQA